MLTADVFQKIVDAAISLEHKTYHTGGNAALMANKYVSSLIFIIVLMWGSLAERGCPVMLGGAVGDKLGSLLHRDGNSNCFVAN